MSLIVVHTVAFLAHVESIWETCSISRREWKVVSATKICCFSTESKCFHRDRKSARQSNLTCTVELRIASLRILWSYVLRTYVYCGVTYCVLICTVELRTAYLRGLWSYVLRTYVYCGVTLLHTYSLHGAVLLEKLTGTRRFITAFTKTCHLSISWASSTQSIPHIPLPEDTSSWRLSSHLRLGHPIGIFLYCGVTFVKSVSTNSLVALSLSEWAKKDNCIAFNF
jgi:hypothetical protein